MRSVVRERSDSAKTQPIHDNVHRYAGVSRTPNFKTSNGIGETDNWLSTDI